MTVSCGNSRPCSFGFSSWICPLQLLQVPREEARTGGSVTWPKPPWGPRLAGQWAPAPTRLAPLQGHASCPPPLRRRTPRTTRQSCTGNLQARAEPRESRGQGSRSRNPVDTIKCIFFAFPSVISLSVSLISSSGKHTAQARLPFYQLEVWSQRNQARCHHTGEAQRGAWTEGTADPVPLNAVPAASLKVTG